ncbi:hypothetical protein CVH13_01172 [Dehalococcoides mccartyi]|uniref:Uncharacterized protein n=1 Tax=Dehalococcoides mccartyi TaxID=61435 RepID=A0A2J1DVV6_9CHLR|nr:hypothetical protein CVH13_01172 [Dehalococcoides mccartyi]
MDYLERAVYSHCQDWALGFMDWVLRSVFLGLAALITETFLVLASDDLGMVISRMPLSRVAAIF